MFLHQLTTLGEIVQPLQPLPQGLDLDLTDHHYVVCVSLLPDVRGMKILHQTFPYWVYQLCPVLEKNSAHGCLMRYFEPGSHEQQ